MPVQRRSYEYQKDRIVRDAAMIVFTVVIAILGAAMMTLTSSPLVKGAAFLWLPAALQLIAGVWLGPWRGAFAAGVGAQAAGVIAYGGWAPPDFIMNLVAGGFANAFLPGVLFRWFKIDPSFGASKVNVGRALVFIVLATFVAIALALYEVPLAKSLHLNLEGPWTFAPPIIALLVIVVIGGGMGGRFGDFVLALIVATFSCFVSAAIGTVGAVVGGQSLQAAIYATGIGWFLGDTASAVLGLYVLAQFTTSAQRRGIAPVLTTHAQ